jgi:hypothetical protein
VGRGDQILDRIPEYEAVFFGILAKLQSRALVSMLPGGGGSARETSWRLTSFGWQCARYLTDRAAQNDAQ